MIADFDEAVSGLVPEASTNRFEQSLAELGTYLGFETQRPDHQFWIGPDVLWIAPDPHDFVIEAKSHKEAYNPLYKGDHAQLLEAEHWYKTTYPNRAAVRVSALREAAADAKASTAGTMALTLDALARLSGAVRRLLEELVVEEGDEGAIQRRCEALLITNSLTPDALKKCFLVPFDDPLAPLRSARHPLVGSAAQYRRMLFSPPSDGTIEILNQYCGARRAPGRPCAVLRSYPRETPFNTFLDPAFVLSRYLPSALTTPPDTRLARAAR